MTCKLCLARGKTWEGSDPKCAFDNENFDNWNCATISCLREITENEDLSEVNYICSNDQHYSTIYSYSEDNYCVDIILWLSWYKSRGRTEAIWKLNEYDVPRHPSEEECLKVITYFNSKYDLGLIEDI